MISNASPHLNTVAEGKYWLNSFANRFVRSFITLQIMVSFELLLAVEFAFAFFYFIDKLFGSGQV